MWYPSTDFQLIAWWWTIISSDLGESISCDSLCTQWRRNFKAIQHCEWTCREFSNRCDVHVSIACFQEAQFVRQFKARAWDWSLVWYCTASSGKVHVHWVLRSPCSGKPSVNGQLASPIFENVFFRIHGQLASPIFENVFFRTRNARYGEINFSNSSAVDVGIDAHSSRLISYKWRRTMTKVEASLSFPCAEKSLFISDCPSSFFHKKTYQIRSWYFLKSQEVVQSLYVLPKNQRAQFMPLFWLFEARELNLQCWKELNEQIFDAAEKPLPLISDFRGLEDIFHLENSCTVLWEKLFSLIQSGSHHWLHKAKASGSWNLIFLKSLL